MPLPSLELPVVSAVGHETDFTIADFVADLRAPTPSAAAELLTEAQHKVEERLEQLHRRLNQACRYLLMRAQERFARLSAPAAFARMRNALARRQQRVDELQYQLDAAWHRQSRQMAERLQKLEGRLLRQDVSHRMRMVRERLAMLDGRIGRAQQELLLRLEGEARTCGGAVAGCLSPGGAESGLCPGFRRSGGPDPGCIRCSRRRPDHHTIRAKHADQPGARKEVAPKQLMRKLFGTDGIRAVAGEAPLDAPTIFATGLALASTLKHLYPAASGSAGGGYPRIQSLDLGGHCRRIAERRC